MTKPATTYAIETLGDVIDRQPFKTDALALLENQIGRQHLVKVGTLSTPFGEYCVEVVPICPCCKHPTELTHWRGASAVCADCFRSVVQAESLAEGPRLRKEYAGDACVRCGGPIDHLEPHTYCDDCA